MRMKRLVSMVGLVFVLGVACIGGIAQAAEEAAEAPVPNAAVAPVVPAEAPAATSEEALTDAGAVCEEPMSSDLEPDTSAGGPGCKPCKGRSWCKCTYNGFPRSTCDPCCYVNDIGIPICLD